MCDTLVALGDVTSSGTVLFAKNSDREPNEAHEVVHAAAAEHGRDDLLRCTYIAVPQAPRTHAVLLAKPYWIWGAEMGANEHGVVIGNEAVFTRVPTEKTPGLIGMDLLRLGLERAETAEAAVSVVTEMLGRFGQGGNCGHEHRLEYHNSFIVADRREAWVLETAGRDWAARRVEGAASISNVITTGGDFDRASPGLVEHAVARRWCRSRDDFDFGADYSDRLYTTFSDARERQCRTAEALAAGSGGMDVPGAWSILADHGVRAEGRADWGPDRHPLAGVLGQTVCAHAGFGPVRVSQTTGSWVSSLGAPDGSLPDTHWVSGTAAPCLSLRMPVWFDALATTGMPHTGSRPGRGYAPGSLWWDHEDLHRAVLKDYAPLRALFAEDRAEVQHRIDALATQAMAGPVEHRVAASQEAFAAAVAATRRWRDLVVPRAPARWGHSPYQRAWRRFDRAAGRPVATPAAVHRRIHVR